MVQLRYAIRIIRYDSCYISYKSGFAFDLYLHEALLV